MERAGRVAVSVTADVSDEGPAARAITKPRHELGPVDLLINIAGIVSPSARRGRSNPTVVADHGGQPPRHVAEHAARPPRNGWSAARPHCEPQRPRQGCSGGPCVCVLPRGRYARNDTAADRPRCAVRCAMDIERTSFCRGVLCRSSSRGATGLGEVARPAEPRTTCAVWMRTRSGRCCCGTSGGKRMIRSARTTCTTTMRCSNSHSRGAIRGRREHP